MIAEKDKEQNEKTIEKLGKFVEGYNKLQQRKYQNVEKDLQEELRNNVAPEHELLYKKIDLYLEKISKLDNVEKYQLLDILISKYGRDYIESNEPKENPQTVYCKFGNVVQLRR